MKTKPKIQPFTEVHPSVESLRARHYRQSGIIYLSTLLGVLGFLAATPLIEVDIQQQSRGIIRSVQENNQLTAPMHGQVQHLQLHNGQEVRKGALLLELDTRQLDQQIDQQEQLRVQTSSYIQDLNQLLDTSLQIPRLSTPLFQQARFQFEKQRKQYDLQVQRAERDWQRAQQLYQNGAIAAMEQEEKQYWRDYHLSALEQFCQEQRQSWMLSLQRYEEEALTISHRIAQLREEKKQYRVYAPVDGTIQQLIGIQPGNTVNAGQALAQIITNDSLLAEIYVSPARIGLLRPGMPVRLQIDAFNYHQWGLAEGQISDIASDVSMLNGQPQFLVRCQLAQNSLQLPNGYQGQLKKGMTLTAHFQVSRRSLYQLLYDQVDDWVNPRLSQPAPSN